MKNLLDNIKYNLLFLKVLNSPFKGLKLKWYFGEIKHGTPYFLPRKWIKCDKQDAVRAWVRITDEMKKIYIDKWGNEDEYYDYYIRTFNKPVPIKKFGVNFTTLGWKTKFDDYRFEWSPSISIVIFGKQLFISILPKVDIDKYIVALDCYWEAWLTYENLTDKTKTMEERIEELQKIYSCSWGSPNEGYINYYPIILKEKYHYLLNYE